MLRLWQLLAVLLVSSLPAAAYENPILPRINDPDCILLDGAYRLIEPEGGTKAGHFAYRTSTDLVHWSDPIPILLQAPGTALWQGSFLRDTDGQLYLYSAAVAPGRLKTIHVARAADFTEPFTDLGVVAQNAIDPFPIRAADGSLWLYYKDDSTGQKGIWAQRMTDPATPALTTAVEILHPRPHTFEDNGYQSVEGPTVIYRAGLYFLLYTGGPFDQTTYAVGYAVSKSPDGPFQRGPNNPILSNSKSPGVYSPGVPTVVQDGAGQSWLVYRQRATAGRKSPRQLTIDPLDDSRAAEGILSASAKAQTNEPDPVPLP